eukprot:TRINITY_DN7427_c0_g1_i1.p1 TRINITY_DN7427_c0_g1~~TRINITY_DN7427_c0_g1_i1.p1  ORF type:complete len:522 (-),score=63.36 TRINITY_DN7427_c0_g1_i1:448-2013(-)
MSSLAIKARPTWVPDNTGTVCSKCFAIFSTLNRRHHCRCCGQIFCNSCASLKLPLPKYGYDKPVRVCKCCFDITQYLQKADDISLALRAEAAKGLSNLTLDGHCQMKMVEQGCVDVLSNLLSNLIITDASSGSVVSSNSSITSGVETDSTNDETSIENAVRNIKIYVTKAFANLTKNASNRAKLIDSGVPRKMVSILNEGEENEISLNAVQALEGLACFESSAINEQIVQSCLPTLIELSRGQNQQIRASAATTLLNLTGNPFTCSGVVSGGVIQAFIGLALSEDSPLQIIACKGLSRLIEAGPKFQSQVTHSGSLLPLVLLLSSTNEEVLENATRVLASLSESKDSQVAIVSSGAVKPLVEICNHQYIGVQQNASKALFHLSENKNNLENMSEPQTILPLLKVVGGNLHFLAQEHLLATLSNLAECPQARSIMESNPFGFIQRIKESISSVGRDSEGKLFQYIWRILSCCDASLSMPSSSVRAGLLNHSSHNIPPSPIFPSLPDLQRSISTPSLKNFDSR